MVVKDVRTAARQGGEQGRREAVLESAMSTFARFGYRKTSMEDVARDARISRPGLYFLFSTKQDLFREAVTRTLEQDLAVCQTILAAPAPALSQRVAEAFEQWAGRYVGPMKDVMRVVEDNPETVGPIVRTAPARFSESLARAIADAGVPEAASIAQTLISTSVGLKHQVDTREEYADRLATAISLMLPCP